MKRRDFIKYATPLAVGVASLPLLAKAVVAPETTPRSIRFSSDGTIVNLDAAHRYICETSWDIPTAEGTGELYFDMEQQAMYVSRGYIRNKLGLKTPNWIKINEI